jgi:hypothetical protein
VNFVDPTSNSESADYLIFFAVLIVAGFALTVFIAWWNLSYRKNRKSHHRHGRHRHRRSGEIPSMPGTEQTLTRKGMKK